MVDEPAAVQKKSPTPKSGKAHDPDGFKPSDLEPHDWALAVLMSVTVDLSTENSLGLSVIAGGSLISGIAIHREKWADLITSQIRDAGVDGSTDSLAEALKLMYETAFKRLSNLKERRDASDLAMPPSVFLHFRDARVYTGTWVNYPLFRVNLDDVTGWSIGSHES